MEIQGDNMALCENFDCKGRSWCRGAGPKCESVCLNALYIHKCSSCSNREACKGSDLYKKAQAERDEVMNRWKTKERSSDESND